MSRYEVWGGEQMGGNSFESWEHKTRVVAARCCG